MSDEKIVDGFKDLIEDLAGDEGECMKAYGGVKCRWKGTLCSDVTASGNITFQTKYSQEIHIPLSDFMIDLKGECLLMIAVNSS